jgi:hypothetical protein
MKQTAGNTFKITFSLLSLLIFDGQSVNGQPVACQVPGLSVSQFAFPKITPTTEAIIPTGTAIGCQVAEIKKTLEILESQIATTIQGTREIYENAILNVNQYHKTTALIEAKLQLGTTPANPQLVELRHKASQQLSQIIATIEVMKGLAQSIGQSSAQVNSLAIQVSQTLRLPGAVDEDHAHLILINDGLRQLGENVRRTLGVVQTNIGRQAEWSIAQGLHLENLSRGIEAGQINVICEGEGARHLSAPKHKAKSHHHPKKHPVKTLPLPSSQPVSAHSQEVSPQLKASLPPLPKVEKNQPMEPLPKVSIESQPAIPVSPTTLDLTPASKPEAASQKTEAVESLIDFETAAKGRSPLAVLEGNQNPEEHQWYLTSSAQRGLSSSTDVLDIISVTDKSTPSKKGEDVKKVLIARGYKPEQLHVIAVTGGSDQTGKIYLFH